MRGKDRISLFVDIEDNLGPFIQRLRAVKLEAEKSLNHKATLDTSQYERELEGLKLKRKELQREMDQAARAIKTVQGHKIDGKEVNTSEMEKEYHKLHQSIKLLDREIKSHEMTLNGLGRTYNRVFEGMISNSKKAANAIELELTDAMNDINQRMKALKIQDTISPNDLAVLRQRLAELETIKARALAAATTYQQGGRVKGAGGKFISLGGLSGVQSMLDVAGGVDNFSSSTGYSLDRMGARLAQQQAKEILQIQKQLDKDLIASEKARARESELIRRQEERATVKALTENERYIKARQRASASEYNKTQREIAGINRVLDNVSESLYMDEQKRNLRDLDDSIKQRLRTQSSGGRGGGSGGGGRRSHVYGFDRFNFNPDIGSTRLGHAISRAGSFSGISAIAGVTTLGAGFGLTKGIIDQATEAQKLKTLLAGLINTYGQFTDAAGKAVDAQRNFGLSMQYSQTLYTELRKQAVESPLTTQEMFSYFMAGGPTLMGRGVRPDKAIGVVDRMASLGVMMGLAPRDIEQDIRALAMGDVRGTNKIGKLLGFTGPEISDAYKQKGGQGFVDLFDQKFKGLGPAYDEIAKSFVAKWSALVDKMQQLGVMMGEKVVPLLIPAIDRMMQSLEGLAKTGALEQLAHSLGNFLVAVMDTFKWFSDNIMPHIDSMEDILMVGIVGLLGRFVVNLGVQAAAANMAVGGFLGAIGAVVTGLIMWKAKLEGDIDTNANTIRSAVNFDSLEPQKKQQIIGASISRMADYLEGKQKNLISSDEKTRVSMVSALDANLAMHNKAKSKGKNAWWNIPAHIADWYTEMGVDTNVAGNTHNIAESAQKLRNRGAAFQFDSIQGLKGLSAAYTRVTGDKTARTGHELIKLIQGLPDTTRRKVVADLRRQSADAEAFAKQLGLGGPNIFNPVASTDDKGKNKRDRSTFESEYQLELLQYSGQHIANLLRNAPDGASYGGGRSYKAALLMRQYGIGVKEAEMQHSLDYDKAARGELGPFGYKVADVKFAQRLEELTNATDEQIRSLYESIKLKQQENMLLSKNIQLKEAEMQLDHREFSLSLENPLLDPTGYTKKTFDLMEQRGLLGLGRTSVQQQELRARIAVEMANGKPIADILKELESGGFIVNDIRQIDKTIPRSWVKGAGYTNAGAGITPSMFSNLAIQPDGTQRKGIPDLLGIKGMELQIGMLGKNNLSDYYGLERSAISKIIQSIDIPLFQKQFGKDRRAMDQRLGMVGLGGYELENYIKGIDAENLRMQGEDQMEIISMSMQQNLSKLRAYYKGDIPTEELQKVYANYAKSMQDVEDRFFKPAAELEQDIKNFQKSLELSDRSFALAAEQMQKIAETKIGNSMDEVFGDNSFDAVDLIRRLIDTKRANIEPEVDRRILSMQQKALKEGGMVIDGESVDYATLESSKYFENKRTQLLEESLLNFNNFILSQQGNVGIAKRNRAIYESSAGFLGNLAMNPMQFLSDPLGTLNNAAGPISDLYRGNYMQGLQYFFRPRNLSFKDFMQQNPPVMGRDFGVNGLIGNGLFSIPNIQYTPQYMNMFTDASKKYNMKSKAGRLEAMYGIAGDFLGNIGGNMLGSALFPNKDSASIMAGTSLGTALGGAFGSQIFAGLGAFGGPVGAMAGGIIGGLFGGLFGGKKKDPEKERQKQLQKQHQDNLEKLLNSIDKRLRPQEDYFNTIRGEALFGASSRWFSGRAYAGLGLQGAVGRIF